MNERTNFIIAYLADLSGVEKKLKGLERINSVIAKEFGADFTKAAKQVGDAVENITKKTIKLKGGKTAIQELKTLSTTVKTTDGQLKTLVETQRRVDGALKSSTTSFKQAGASNTFSANLTKLISRAALTIPTWFLLRNAVRSVFVTIRDGFKSFVEFDSILQKARRNLTGSAEKIDSDFKRVKASIEALAIATGESVTDIADSFQRFATLGFDAETSLAGATAATKLAVLQFDDLQSISNGLARTYKVLSGSFEEGTNAADNLATTVALLDELWLTNAFDANELIGALQRFAPTAGKLNISLEQSAKLLATLQSAAVVNTRAGRLLGRSFDELAGNIGKVGRVLGLEVNPTAEGTFDVFVKVIRALEAMRKEEGFNTRLQSTLRELFGGRIGIEAPAAFAAIRDQLEKNLALTGDVAQFEKRLAEVTDTVSRQAKIFDVLRTAAQRAFVEGLAGGGDNAIESLKSLNEFTKGATLNMKALGSVIRDNIIILRNLATIIATPSGAGVLIDEQKAKKELEKVEKLTGDVNKALFGQLDFAGVADVLTRAIQSVQNNEGIISEQSVSALRDVLDRLGKGETIDLKFEELSREDVIAKAEETKAILAAQNQVLDDQKILSQEIVRNELERLKLAGATESQLLRAKTNLNAQLKIGEDAVTLAKRELQIQKEIREERRLQNNLSSESLKLFRIAQSEGSRVAGRISDVLSGEIDFDLFERQGGRALDVFKKQFGDIFESQQAQRFFSGERINGVRGGAGIGIRENVGRGIPSFSASAQIAQQRAFRSIEAPTPADRPIQQTNNVNITNNITATDAEETKRIVEKTIVDGFNNPQSSITIAAKNTIGEF